MNMLKKVLAEAERMAATSHEGLIAARLATLAGARAERFVLPTNGVLLDDPEFRAIEGVQLARLPFPVVALEFEAEPEDSDEITHYCLIAEEFPEEEAIRTTGWFRRSSNYWFPCVPARMVARDFIRGRGERPWAVVAPASRWVVSEEFDTGKHSFDLQVIAGFLNALACRNVKIDDIPPSRTLRARMQASGEPVSALDHFHVLVLDSTRPSSRSPGNGGTHRSPREHVRRGHIRVLEKGPIWVNSTVVNAGSDGKVSKVYKIRKSS